MFIARLQPADGGGRHADDGDGLRRERGEQSAGDVCPRDGLRGGQEDGAGETVDEPGIQHAEPGGLVEDLPLRLAVEAGEMIGIRGDEIGEMGGAGAFQ